MRYLYLVMGAILFNSCLGYKMARIYEPKTNSVRIDGVSVIFDSASFEHAMFQDRLKLNFLTENKLTNTTVYDFCYYQPYKFSERLFGNYTAPSYVNTSLIDLSLFEKNYKKYLIGYDTMLFKGIEGVDEYIKKTKNDKTKIVGLNYMSKKSASNDLVTLVPVFKNPKTLANSINSSSSIMYVRTQPIVTYGDLSYEMSNAIAYTLLSAIEENQALKLKHSIGSKITSSDSNKIVVQLHNYHSDVIPTITDAYKLLYTYSCNEFIDTSGFNKEDIKGYIRYRVIDKQYKLGLFWMIANAPFLYIPTFFGSPLTSQKITIKLEAVIYDKDMRLIKSYVTQGTGKAYMAFYWGYAGSASPWMPMAMSRTSNSKAIYAALTELSKQIQNDKKEIEEILNKNARYKL
jgi:hypothetical protein